MAHRSVHETIPPSIHSVARSGATMMRAASAALMPFVEARALLLALADPVPSEAIPLADASGHICAEPVLAPRDVPERRRASRDGYAVAAADVGGASPYAPVRLLATPFWVEAGDDLPDGTDAVLPPEGLEGRDTVSDVFVHEGVRERADDLSSGDVVVAMGERIASRHVLALAHCALSEIRIRRPRVTLIVTGAPGPEALSAFLTAAITREGGTARTVAVPDSEDAIAAAILDTDAHAILVLGGTGFGRTDHSAAGLARAGRILAHGIALRPGETSGIGVADGRPVILVPGSPEAAMAVFLTLGRPLMTALSGGVPSASRRARLRRKIASGIGLSEVVFGRHGPGEVEPLGSADLPLRGLIRADAAMLVPPEREGYPEGTEVEVLDL